MLGSTVDSAGSAQIRNRARSDLGRNCWLFAARTPVNQSSCCADCPSCKLLSCTPDYGRWTSCSHSVAVEHAANKSCTRTGTVPSHCLLWSHKQRSSCTVVCLRYDAMPYKPPESDTSMSRSWKMRILEPIAVCMISPAEKCPTVGVPISAPSQ